MRYEASKIDETTWMVKRYFKKDGVESWDESLMRGMTEGIEPEQVIGLAVERGSWA